MSDSPRLVDFAIRLVNSVFNLHDRQVMFLRNSNNKRTVKSILLVKKLLGLVEMTKQCRYPSSGHPTDSTNYILHHKMRFEFPINLIGKLTAACLTGQSWCLLKSWYTGGSSEQGFWCFADELDQKLSSICGAGFWFPEKLSTGM